MVLKCVASPSARPRHRRSAAHTLLTYVLYAGPLSAGFPACASTPAVGSCTLLVMARCAQLSAGRLALCSREVISTVRSPGLSARAARRYQAHVAGLRWLPACTSHTPVLPQADIAPQHQPNLQHTPVFVHLSLRLACVQTMLFINGKARSLYFQRKKAASLAWTVTYRRLHKKDQAGEQTKRKRRNLHSKKPRAIGNLTVEVRHAVRLLGSPQLICPDHCIRKSFASQDSVCKGHDLSRV